MSSRAGEHTVMVNKVYKAISMECFLHMNTFLIYFAPTINIFI